MFVLFEQNDGGDDQDIMENNNMKILDLKMML